MQGLLQIACFFGAEGMLLRVVWDKALLSEETALTDVLPLLREQPDIRLLQVSCLRLLRAL